MESDPPIIIMSPHRQKGLRNCTSTSWASVVGVQTRTRCVEIFFCIKTYINPFSKTLPKALRTKALTASTSKFGLIWWVGFGVFGSVGLLG